MIRAPSPTGWMAVCFACAFAPGQRALHAQALIQDQWERSPHAGSLDTPAEKERMNRTGCAHCHTAQGYHEVILAGEASSAPYGTVEGITCRTCHVDSADSSAVSPLRVGDPRDACRGCHDQLVTNREDALSWCSQWGIFEGTGGMSDVMAVSKVGHATLEKGCVACHMAPTEDGASGALVGGHTFRVKTKGELPPAFNAFACLDCHTEMTAEDLIRSQEQVAGLLAGLARLLPQRPDPERPEETVPRFPADPSLTPLQVRGSYNYWLVEKDGSLGVHNPAYTRALLEASIGELKAGR